MVWYSIRKSTHFSTLGLNVASYGVLTAVLLKSQGGECYTLSTVIQLTMFRRTVPQSSSGSNSCIYSALRDAEDGGSANLDT